MLTSVPSPALVVGAIGSVQFGAAIATTLFNRIGPSGAVALRLSLATVVLVGIWRPAFRGRPPREYALACTFGLVLGVMNLSFYESIHRIPLGIAVTIEFVGPLLVAVFGSRRASDFIWVVLAAIGIVALMHGDTHSLNTVGVLLALAAGLLWGGYILINARVGREFNGGAGLALAMCMATLVTLPVGLAQAGSKLFEPHALLLGAAVAMLSSVIPYSFELEALRRIATNIFGVLMSIEPGMAALAGFVVVGQKLSGREIVGIAFVVAASIGASLRARAAPVDA
jgi:inner membrane transporter RhtA